MPTRPTSFSSNEGVVKIQVEAIFQKADEPERRRVRVEADYPDHPHQRARHTK